MNKKNNFIKFLLGIFILNLFISPNFSFAEVILKAVNTTENSTTLVAGGLTKNTSVIFEVVNKNSATTPYSESRQTITDNSGNVLVDFTGLSSGEEYAGSVYYSGENKAVGTTTFSTNDGMKVKITSIEKTLVEFTLLGFPKNKEISFTVSNYDYKTPTYSESQDLTTDDTGAVSTKFYGLSPGGRYRYSHNEPPGTGSFYTFDEDTGSKSGGSSGGSVMGSTDPNGLIPCNTTANPKACEFKDILGLINKVINFLLFVLAVPIAAIMFAYAGFTLIFSGGSSEKMSQAKSVFMNVAIGLVLAAAAWLIVHTILNIVGFDGSWIGL